MLFRSRPLAKIRRGTASARNHVSEAVRWRNSAMRRLKSVVTSALLRLPFRQWVENGCCAREISTQEVFHGGSGSGSIFKQGNQLDYYTEGNPQRVGSDMLRNIRIGAVWHSALLLFHLRDPLTDIESCTFALAVLRRQRLCLPWRQEN